MDKIEAIMLMVAALVGFVLGRIDREATRAKVKQQEIKRRIEELRAGKERYRI